MQCYVNGSPVAAADLPSHFSGLPMQSVKAVEMIESGHNVYVPDEDKMKKCMIKLAAGETVDLPLKWADKLVALGKVQVVEPL